eukprot:tig00020554_g10892.t1
MATRTTTTVSTTLSVDAPWQCAIVTPTYADGPQFTVTHYPHLVATQTINGVQTQLLKDSKPFSTREALTAAQNSLRDTYKDVRGVSAGIPSWKSSHNYNFPF